MNYGKAIRVCRAAFGLRQAELAAHLSIGPSQLSLIESGRRKPSVRTIEEICRALQVPQPLLLLLASSPEDLEHQTDDTLALLGQSLLTLLVSATEEDARQQRLPLRK